MLTNTIKEGLIIDFKFQQQDKNDLEYKVWNL
jgi:hypothetical protein